MMMLQTTLSLHGTFRKFGKLTRRKKAMLTKHDWDNRHVTVKMLVANFDSWEKSALSHLLKCYFNGKMVKDIPFPTGAPRAYVTDLIFLMQQTMDTEWQTLASHWKVQLDLPK